METNKGFIRYVGTANGKYYADIDFTEKNPCETPGIENDLECEGSSDNKNENKTTKSILIADNVTFFDVGCYYYDKSLKENSFFKIESLVILMQEMQNTPFSKCGYSDEHQDTRLYFFNFNKYGEIRSIASDQIYNQ